MNNLAPQARFLLSTAFLLLVGSLLVLAHMALPAPFALIAVVLVALLYRIVRRYFLYRLGYAEVPNRWVRPDPLGSMIDSWFVPEHLNGDTIRLDEEVPQ